MAKTPTIAFALLMAIALAAPSWWSGLYDYRSPVNCTNMAGVPIIANGTHGAVLGASTVWAQANCTAGLYMYYTDANAWAFGTNDTQAPHARMYGGGYSLNTTSLYKGYNVTLFLNETSGVTAYNAAGGPNFSSNATPNSAGVFGSAYSFTNSRVSASIGQVGSSTDFTRNIWIKPGNIAATQTIWQGTATDNKSCAILQMDSSGVFISRTKPGVAQTDSSKVAIPAGSWLMLTVTYNATSGNMTLYINGTERASLSQTGIAGGNCVGGEWLGFSNDYTNYLIANLSGYTVQASKLSASQVDALFKNSQSAAGYGNLGAREVISTAPPSMLNVSISPSPAVYNNTAYCRATAEGTGSITGYWHFYVNMVLAQYGNASMVSGSETVMASIGSGNFSYGDVLLCQVYANNGLNTSNNMSSTSVYVTGPSNTIPVLPITTLVWNMFQMYGTLLFSILAIAMGYASVRQISSALFVAAGLMCALFLIFATPSYMIVAVLYLVGGVITRFSGN